MLVRGLTNKRGNVLLFTLVLVLPMLLIFAGLATDMAYYGDIDNELQRAMDAAALAGAGKLGFSADNFPDARQWAHDYAQLNKYRGGSDTINLDLNTANAAGGQIVLGIWDPTARSFTPSLNGNLVNAVQTRFATTIPTSFLKIIGVTILNSSATAIAWAPPPTIPPVCPFPIALTLPNPAPPGNGVCGQAASFISSSCTSPVGCNTAGWANLGDGTTAASACGNPSASTTKTAIDNAVNAGSCPIPPLKTGDTIGIDNGMQQSSLDEVIRFFPTEFASSGTITIQQTNQSTGQPETVYSGHGWKVAVPVVDPSGATNSCTVVSSLFPFKGTILARVWEKIFPCVGTAYAAGGGTPLNQNMPIIGWTQFVITQIVNGNSGCVVDNPNDTVNTPNMPPTGTNGIPCGTKAGLPNGFRGIFGFFQCEVVSTPGAAGAVASLGQPKLVK